MNLGLRVLAGKLYIQNNNCDYKFQRTEESTLDLKLPGSGRAFRLTHAGCNALLFYAENSDTGEKWVEALHETVTGGVQSCYLLGSSLINSWSTQNFAVLSHRNLATLGQIIFNTSGKIRS